MNFRILAASVGPRGRLLAFLAASALAVPFAMTAHAQAPEAAPKAPAKKKAAPKAPAAKEWCKWDYAPVCGTVGGKKQTFGNACFAKEAGAKKIKKGACK